MLLPNLTGFIMPTWVRSAEADENEWKQRQAERAVQSSTVQRLKVNKRALPLDRLLDKIRLPALNALSFAHGLPEAEYDFVAGFPSLTTRQPFALTISPDDAEDKQLHTLSALTNLEVLADVDVTHLQPLTVFTKLEWLSLRILDTTQPWQPLLQPSHQLPKLGKLRLLTERAPAD